MKSKEFIRNSALDDMIAQAKKPEPVPAQPKYPISGAVGKVADVATSAVKGLTTGVQSGGGYSVGSFAQPLRTQKTGLQPLSTDNPQINPQIAQYLKQAAGNQPVKQATDNQGINNVLKSIGLLK